MGRALEPYKLYWIEEPVATDDIDGSARVADALATPIAGYETEIGLYGFRELITRGAVDIVQPDIAWTGGFSEGRRIAALAQAHHLMVAPHAFGGGGIARCVIAFRRLDPERAGAGIRPEPERIARRIAEGADCGLDGDGMIRLPERPGLGIELDPAAVERYRVSRGPSNSSG